MERRTGGAKMRRWVWRIFMVIAAAAALAGSALAANPDEEFEFMSNGSGE